ncbi:hypothetical protein ACROYT_G037599 [Oculina patagonica]
MKKAGVNWAKSLPEYERALNLDPKEELAWKSPFEIYYERKPNILETKGNQPVPEWDIPSNRYQGMIHPRSKDYTDHARKTRKLRNLAHSACADRMVKRDVRNNPPSVYDIGETVLIRYPPAKKVRMLENITYAWKTSLPGLATQPQLVNNLVLAPVLPGDNDTPMDSDTPLLEEMEGNQEMDGN